MINLSKKNFIRKASKWLAKISEWIKTHGGGQIIPVSCEFEQELFDLKEYPDQQKAFLEECNEAAKKAGLKGPQAEVKSMVPRLIRAGRTALCLESFYTAGPKEVRAWTIMKGTLAPQAAGMFCNQLYSAITAERIFFSRRSPHSFCEQVSFTLILNEDSSRRKCAHSKTSKNSTRVKQVWPRSKRMENTDKKESNTLCKMETLSSLCTIQQLARRNRCC